MGNAKSSRKASGRTVEVSLDEQGEETPSEIWTPSLAVAMSPSSKSVAVSYRTSGTEIIELSGRGLQPEIARQLLEFGKGLHHFASPIEGGKAPRPVFTLFLDKGDSFGAGGAYIEISIAQQVEDAKPETDVVHTQTKTVVEEVMRREVSPVQEAPLDDQLASLVENKFNQTKPEKEKSGLYRAKNPLPPISEETVETQMTSALENEISIASFCKEPKSKEIPNSHKTGLKLSTVSAILEKPHGQETRRDSFLSQKMSSAGPVRGTVPLDPHCNRPLSTLYVRSDNGAVGAMKRSPKTEAWVSYMRTLQEMKTGSDESLSDFSDYETESKMTLSSESNEEKKRLEQMTPNQPCSVRLVDDKDVSRIMC